MQNCANLRKAISVIRFLQYTPVIMEYTKHPSVVPKSSCSSTKIRANVQDDHNKMLTFPQLPATQPFQIGTEYVYKVKLL